MTRPIAVFLVGFAVLAALPAQARFGKKSEPTPSTEHEAQSVPSHGNGTGGSYPQSGSGSGRYARRGGGRYGYWSGSFVPSYGFVYYAAPPAVVVAQPVEEQPEPEPESAGIRLGAGVEGQGFRGGFTLGALVSLEGDRWGFSASGQNIAALSEDGSGKLDHLQVATAHLTYAFVAGRFGRLRVEGGADAVFAPALIVVGPTAGLSGTLWIGGPFALEGSAMVTPWPYRQFDGKIGVALGLGPVGLRAGFRAQLLDDRGLVDGVVHQDSFLGPYVGVSLVF